MHDFRMVGPALGAWLALVWVVEDGMQVALLIAASCLVVTGLLLWRGTGGLMRLAALCLVVTAVMSLLAGLRVAQVTAGPLSELADDRAMAEIDASVSADARTISPQLSMFEATARVVTVRDGSYRIRSPMTVFVRGEPTSYAVGDQVSIAGRLAPSDRSGKAATLSATRIERSASTAWWWSASSAMRAAVNESVSRAPARSAALVPALVHGDDQGLSDDLEADFQRSGLTHLLAVSGTNLTIVLVCVLLIGQACGIHGRGQWLLGAIAVIAFVMMARPDPSVVRAAGMGIVALSALGYGRRGGIRALSWAIIGLLLIDPWLSRSIGFVLSVFATAGILLLAPRWTTILSQWMPRLCAAAIAVPTAAQLAVTPVIAAISAEVSLVAVAANLLAGPAVAPATVLGLLGGAIALVFAPMSHLVGLLATLFAHWIITVGTTAASLPGAAFGWEQPVWMLVVLCLATGSIVTWLFARPWLLAGLVMALAVGFVRPPDRGWPPPDWVMVACDVGQGDATVLNAGDGAAVVVDAGPDARSVNRCLRRLDVASVPLMIFSHGHADHTGGWRGVTRGRRVDFVVTGPGGGPAVEGAESAVMAAGDSLQVGAFALEVLAPTADVLVAGADSSATNNASLVIAARSRGVDILLTGDIESDAQRSLLSAAAPVRTDILKMPHHGSRDQDGGFVEQLGARFATVSAGADNSFGHPARDALTMLRRNGITPLRTDLQGDIAIVARDGKLWAETD